MPGRAFPGTSAPGRTPDNMDLTLALLAVGCPS
jgi:hypothetical protein